LRDSDFRFNNGNGRFNINDKKMKKILIIILALSLWSCQEKMIKSRYTPVNVGTTANDGTGDNLRAAFIKVNAGFAELADSLENIYTEAQTRTLVGDTSAVLRTYTRETIKDTFDVKIASGVDIESYLEDFSGGGGGVGIYELKGIIGTTSGIPEDGDSLIINTGFISRPHPLLYRDGLLQYHQDGATTTGVGFVFNNTTGTITANPPFSDGERIIVQAYDPIIWTSLAPEGGTGGGGTGGESPLLDSLIAVYEMDETAGTTVYDAYGDNDGTTNSTPNQTGIIGKSKLFAGTNYISVPYNATLLPDDDEYSVSIWFRLTQLPADAGHIMYLYRARDSQTPYYMANIFIHTDGYIAVYITNSAGTIYEFETNTGLLSINTWYNLVAVNEGDGEDAKIYLNGSDVTFKHDVAFSGALLEFDYVTYMGNQNASEGYGIVGYMDQVIISKQAFTPADVALIYNSGLGRAYPFN
jgi:hypothetical protein